MSPLLVALLLTSPIEVEIDVTDGPMTAEETFEYRKAKFSQLEDVMYKALSPEWSCQALYNDLFAFWECSFEEEKFGSLFVFQDEQWVKLPGTFKPRL